MKPKIVPEPFSVSSFRIPIKEFPRTEEACLTGLKTPRRHTRPCRIVCCASVTNPLTRALYGPQGQVNTLNALEKDCEAAGSSEPTGVLESSLVRQRLAPRLQSPALAPPADEFTSVCGWFEFRLA
ncbi:MAG: hypothetical protein ACREUU_14785, partial [Gammaproteobacteria bacterium]